MEKCNCLAKIEKSDKSLKELRKEMCEEHKKHFWEWIGGVIQIYRLNLLFLA